METSTQREAGPSRSRSPITPESQRQRVGQKRSRLKNNPNNPQACDRCRVKKRRCHVSSIQGVEACHACHNAGSGCTYDLPLTASRTKRVRNAVEREESSITPVANRPTRDPKSIEVNISRPRVPVDNRYSQYKEGFTAISYILHSAPTVPLQMLESFDEKHGFTMVIGSGATGGDHIAVTAPRPSLLDIDTSLIDPLEMDSRSEMITRLVESYVTHVDFLFPIVSVDDSKRCSPGLSHAMAAVAATRRDCPQKVFDALRETVKQEIEDNDVLYVNTKENIQILLVTCLADDLAVQKGMAGPTEVSRQRLSTAIRMAEENGMNESDRPEDVHIWQCALIIDAWNAARTGSKLLYSKLDLKLPLGQRASRYPLHQSLSDLSMLLRRLLVLIYGKEGVTTLSDRDLLILRDDVESWKTRLPEDLRFDRSASTKHSDILHLLHTAISILLYRPFMRWSFICPPNLTLDLDLAVWSELLSSATAALEWVIEQEDLQDLFFFGPYALSLCGFLQYHSWARRREMEGIKLLERVSRQMRRWEKEAIEGISRRQIQLDVIPFFLDIAQRPVRENTSSGWFSRGLDPTKGVLNKLPETSIAGVIFVRDATLPNGGVYVATQKAAREIKDLPKGTVIIGGSPVER